MGNRPTARRSIRQAGQKIGANVVLAAAAALRAGEPLPPLPEAFVSALKATLADEELDPSLKVWFGGTRGGARACGGCGASAGARGREWASGRAGARERAWENAAECLSHHRAGALRSSDASDRPRDRNPPNGRGGWTAPRL